MNPTITLPDTAASEAVHTPGEREASCSRALTIYGGNKGNLFMSATSIVVVAVVIWLFVMAASWSLRWMNALSAIFVAGVIAIGVAVSWQRVEQYHAQKNAVTAFYSRPAPSPVTVPPVTVPPVTVAPPDHARSGT
jgi:hypothetical protein